MLCGFSPGIGDASPASGVSCGCLQCGFLQSAPESAESFTVCFEYAQARSTATTTIVINFFLKFFVLRGQRFVFMIWKVGCQYHWMDSGQLTSPITLAPGSFLSSLLFIRTILFSMKLSQKITSKKSVNSKKLSPFRCDIVSQFAAGFCHTCWGCCRNGHRFALYCFNSRTGNLW